MRIAVIGAGGVGGAFGAALAQAGADVTFVARGAHLQAMRDNGLRIESPRGNVTCDADPGDGRSRRLSGQSTSSCSASSCGTSKLPAPRSSR